MGSNRKWPFGYKMEFGEIVLHPAEAETVCWIYDSYLAGASYNALVDKLQERGIPYDGDKPWNKNMAARILADRRYTGEGGFPSIIPEGQFHMVQAQRQERTTPCQKSPAQKELRKLCGGSPPAWVERQVLGLLNRLIQCPERITCSQPKRQAGHVQCRGGTIDRESVTRTDMLGDVLFEARNHRSLRKEVRIQHLENGIDISSENLLSAVGDHQMLPILSKLRSIQVLRASSVIHSELLSLA